MSFLALAVLSVSSVCLTDAFLFASDRHVTPLQHKQQHATLKDVVCEISNMMELAVDCEAIVVRPELDDVVEVDFEVDGKPANVIFTIGCQETAEAYMKFRAMLEPKWEAMFFKERVIDFFTHGHWVQQVDSAHCTVVSYSIPETEKTTPVDVSCVQGTNCLSFDVRPGGDYYMKATGIELHTKFSGTNVSFIIEEMSENFNFRTAVIPGGRAPTFHAVDLPGQSTRFPGLANSIMPRMIMKRLENMRDLLIEGEPDPDNVSLWHVTELAFVHMFTKLFPVMLTSKRQGSLIDKMCSCPVFKTVCDTAHVEQDEEQNALVVKFQHDPEVSEESEIWLSTECASLGAELYAIASSTHDTKEFLIKVYATLDLLEMISSGQCSLFKFDIPFAHYHLHGSCGEDGDERDCIQLSPTAEGTTEFTVSEFGITIPHTDETPLVQRGRKNVTQDEHETCVNIFVKEAEVHYNVRTAEILESEESVRVDVHIDDHTSVDDNLAEMLSWVGRIEIIDCIRGLMWYLRGGSAGPVSLWPWEERAEIRIIF